MWDPIAQQWTFNPLPRNLHWHGDTWWHRQGGHHDLSIRSRGTSIGTRNRSPAVHGHPSKKLSIRSRGTSIGTDSDSKSEEPTRTTFQSAPAEPPLARRPHTRYREHNCNTFNPLPRNLHWHRSRWRSPMPLTTSTLSIRSRGTSIGTRPQFTLAVHVEDFQSAPAEPPLAQQYAKYWTRPDPVFQSAPAEPPLARKSTTHSALGLTMLSIRSRGTSIGTWFLRQH